MAILAVNLYILAVTLQRKNLWDVVYRHAALSKLGGITQAGILRDSWGYRPPDPEHHLRTLSLYQIVYLFEGKGTFFDSAGRILPVIAGDLIFTFPAVGHCYGPGEDERWSEIYFQFSGPVFDQWHKCGLLNPARPIIHLKPVALWLRRLAAFLDELRDEARALPLLEVCRLQELLAEIVLGRDGKPTEGNELAWATRARALVESDLRHELDLAALADKMNTTVDRFRKRFTRLVGMPPAHYRIARAIDRACELLQQGQLTQRQIAEQLGFSDEYHFSRRFKQVTGTSPREFRRRLQQAQRSAAANT